MSSHTGGLRELLLRVSCTIHCNCITCFLLYYFELKCILLLLACVYVLQCVRMSVCVGAIPKQ